MDAVTLVERYYETIDAGAYDALRRLLVDDFHQERPDRTLDGADRFVGFMREERPDPDTSHEVQAVFEREGGVAVQGRLLRADGSEWFRFVDVFTVDGGRLASLVTYTN